MASADKGAEFLDRGIRSRPRGFTSLSRREQLHGLLKTGMPSGDKPGWPSVDKLYTVVPGQVTVLTGWPGSGKSEWLDAMLVNLTKSGWKVAMFSPENWPIELHISKLIEKLIGKPFRHGPTARVTPEELDACNEEIDESFYFIEPGEEAQALTVVEILDSALEYFRQHPQAKKGLVIDPWNEVEHSRPYNMSETEYVSATLTRVRIWARKHGVHVWIVAHPAKIRREDGKLPVPAPDMISGSQHWWNKADNAITVYRPMENLESREVEVYVQKVRFKHVGRRGVATLNYDIVTGRYSEPLRVVSDRYRKASEGE